MKISSITDFRDNNFNILRMIGAVIVVLAHGYNVKSGRVESEEYVESFVYITGFRALDLFFIFSGFLITASLLNRKDSVRFWVARALRLFPALLVISTAIVFTIGPLNTSEQLSSYFQSGETWRYPLITGLTTHPDMPLPGVFANLPVAGAVNIPIWTLRYELVLYAGLFLAFQLGVLASRRIFGWCFALLLVLYFCVTFLTGLRDEIAFIDHFSHFSVSFAFGSFVWIFQRTLPLSAGVALSLWLLVYLSVGTPLLEIATIVASGYSYFWLAFVPAGSIRQYNRLGDYSYGLYIIHWPIAQTLYSKFADLSPLMIGLCSLVLSLPLAVVSWHAIEKPCLSRVDAVSGLVKRVLSRAAGQSKPRPGQS